MQKRFFRFIALCAALTLPVTVLTACGASEIAGIDTTKTQVYVANYEGGVGRAWLDEAKIRFEEYYKDVEFEQGKKGVEVQIKSDKNVSLSQLKGSSHYLFFTSGNLFNNYIAEGDFLKITDIVKEEKLPGENKTIKDKLSADTDAALTALNGDYYALPFAQALAGVTYNKHLFEAKGFYFADDVSVAPVQNANDPRYGFILNSNIKKSTGPDGLYGTDDDGLPSSVEEYKKLCDCMVHLGVTPFICYAYSYHYTQNLLYSLWANLGGYNEMMLSVSANSDKYGTTDIVEIGQNGKIIQTDGKINVIKDVAIDDSNGYLLNRQVSRYYALDFLQYIFSPERINSYMTPESMTAALSHTDAQLKFMRGEPSGKPVGMLIEGSYWENESIDAGNVKTMKDLHPDYEMDYRFMPMPHLYEGRVEPIGTLGENGISLEDGYKQIGVDVLYTYAIINANAVKGNPVAERVSKLFLQFLFTDESLKKATAITGMTKDVEYEISDEEYSQMSTFAKSVYDVKKHGQIFVPISDAQKYVKNMSSFTFKTLTSPMWTTAGYSFPLNAFRDGQTLNAYFEAVSAYHNDTWWNKLN